MAAYHELYVHLVWATFERLPLIDARIEKRLYAVLSAKCEELGCRIQAVGGTDNHIHALVRLNPVVSISELVRSMKGMSSRYMNRESVLDHAFKWQHGYGAFTLSRRSIKRIADYVLNQKQHHTHGTFLVTLEKMDGD